MSASIATPLFASLAVAATCSFAHASLVDTAWVGPAVGQWEVAGNWSSNSVPNNAGPTTYAVTVGGQSPLVLLSSSVQVSTLATQPGSTVQVTSFGTLALSGGSLANNGAVTLAGVDGLATLRLDSDMTLAGAGALIGGLDGANRVIGANGTVRLTNAAGHTIEGSMLLGANLLRLTNAGTIQANAGFGITMDLSESGTNFNTGTLRTSAPTLLRVLNSTIENAGGVIEAAAGGQVHLISSTIHGGTVRDADGDGPSLVAVSGATVLDSLTLEGALAVPESQSLRIRGDIAAPDGVQLQGGTLQSNLIVDAAEATLTGGCVLSTFSSLQNRIYGSSPFNRLVLPADARFVGNGQFGVQSLALTNHGLIESDGFHDLIIALAGGVGNVSDGTIRSDTDRTLRMVQTELDNTGGLIATTGSGLLTLDGSNITGGTLRSSPGSIFTIDGGSVQGATLDGDGTPGSGVFVVLGGSAQSPYPLFHNATFKPGVKLSGARVGMSGTAHFEGPMSVAAAGGAAVQVQAIGLTLAGPGPTTLGGTSSGAINFQTDGAELIIGAEHSVSVSSNSTSFGGDGIAYPYRDSTAFVTNRGALQPRVRVALGPGGVFTNEGTMDIAVSSNLAIDGVYGDEPIRIVQRDGVLTLNGTFSSSYRIVPSAPVVKYVVGLSKLFVEGGRLQGSGLIIGAVSATGGVIAPGAGSAGTLRVNPPQESEPGAPLYQQGRNATLQVALAQPNVSTGTSMTVMGSVSLDGTLEVLIPGPTEPGTEHVALTCTGPITGTFAAVVCELPVEVMYQTGAVVVRVLEHSGVAGDLNGDGVVSGADLGALLAAWGACGAGACAADLDGNGTVSGADLGILLSNWG